MIQLSILTPGIPSRLSQIGGLAGQIAMQTRDHPSVEHLILIDNKTRTIGEKRDALLRAAIGNYVAFVDDDDWVSPSYVEELLAAMKASRADVITFEQLAEVDGVSGRIVFGLGNPNEPWSPGGTARRNAWHVCAWRRKLAILSHFPPSNYGEDWAFAQKLCGLNGLTSHHIPKVLHHYRHDSKLTAAPPPNAGTSSTSIPRRD